MKKLFVATADVHICLKNLDVSTLVLRQGLDNARRLNVPFVIAGDLNDTKALLRSEYVKALIDLFREYSDVEIIVLIGNHDLNNKASTAHSLEFLKLVDNVRLIDQVTEISFQRTKFMFIPYMNTKEQFHEAIETTRKKKIKRIICHQGFLGAHMGDYAVDDSSYDPSLLSDFSFVGSGHYHLHQWPQPNVMYFGSPFTVNHGESGHEKFLWEIGLENKKIVQKGIPSEVRRHYQVVLENSLPESVDFNIRKDSILKVVLKGTKEFCLGTSRERLQELFEIENLSISTEITRQSNNRISAEMIQKPIEVLKDYVSRAETHFDSDKLLDFIFREGEDVFSRHKSSSNKSYRLKTMRGENFLSFPSLSYEFETAGLTLVEGFDEDRGVATGAGKSSLLDLSCYALFGKTSKDLKADEVVNRKAGKDCVVEVVLEADGEESIVRRYRKHSEFENDLSMILPSGEELRGKDNRETQKLIEQELGFNYELFLRATYFTQFGAVDDFFRSSDTDKKKLFSEISDTKIYDELDVKIREKIKSLKGDVNDLDLIYARTDAKLQSKIVDIDCFSTKLTEHESDREIKESSLQSLLDGWDADRENVLSECRANAKNYLNKRRVRVERLKEEVVAFEEMTEKGRVVAKESLAKTREEISTLEEERVRLQGLSSTSFDIEKNRISHELELVRKSKSIIEESNREKSFLQSRGQQIHLRIVESQNKLQRNLADCPECHQPASPEHIENHIAKLTLELSGVAKSVQERNEEILREEHNAPNESKLLRDLDSLKTQEAEQNAEIKNIKRVIARISELKEKEEDLLAKINTDPLCPSEIELERLSEEENPWPEREKGIISEVNPYIEKIEENKERVNPYIKEVESLALEVEELKTSRSNVQLDMNLVQEMISMADWWKVALHTYIKSYIMDSFLEKINDQANSYLEDLFGGSLKINISSVTEGKKQTKEKINVKIINGNDECSYNSLSGGERARICLAVNLAMSDTIAHSSGKSFNILMLDECFNGLDEVGKAQTMRLLKELEKKFETIFVIDHATEFKSLFSNSVYVLKKNDQSVVV